MPGTQERREREGFGGGDRGRRRGELGREPGAREDGGGVLSATGPEGEGGRWVAYEVVLKGARTAVHEKDDDDACIKSAR